MPSPSTQFWIHVLAEVVNAIRYGAPRAVLILKLQRQRLRALHGQPQDRIETELNELAAFVGCAWECVLDAKASAPGGPQWN